MPRVDGKMVTPDEAIAAAHCPECGADLTKVNPIAELNSHWHAQPREDASGKEAKRRRELLEKFIADNNVGTTNKPATPRQPAAPLP